MRLHEGVAKSDFAGQAGTTGRDAVEGEGGHGVLSEQVIQLPRVHDPRPRVDSHGQRCGGRGPVELRHVKQGQFAPNTHTCGYGERRRRIARRLLPLIRATEAEGASLTPAAMATTTARCRRIGQAHQRDHAHRVRPRAAKRRLI